MTETLAELRGLLESQTWAADWPHNILPPSAPAQELACRAIRALPSLLSTIETDQARLEKAREALEPFVGAFEARRDHYANRYQDKALGLSNFDKMPDEWPMGSLSFSISDFRRARATLTDIKAPTTKGDTE